MNNFLAQELQIEFVLEKGEFDLQRAYAIAFKICHNTLTNEEIKKLTIYVLNKAVEDGEINTYDGVFSSNLSMALAHVLPISNTSLFGVY